MKTLFRAVICGVLCLAVSSCDKSISEFLDKAPGVDVTESTIFSSKVQLETFIAGTYRIGLHSIFTYNDANLIPTSRTYCINAPITDEAECEVTFMHPEQWNAGNVTSATTLVANEDYRYFIRWTAIRDCNIILERLKDVPNLDDTYKNQVIGEVKFIRALNYAEMLKRYGGVPIIDKRFQLTDNFQVKRNTIEDVVNFIVKDCDDAVAKLPATYTSNFRGRITKTAAQMLKSRTLLYAASPLFNTATPYMSLGEDNKLICYGNQDNSRWQLAADAAKAALDLAPAGNFSLITDKGVDKNYKYAWEQNDNAEIVLAEKTYPSRARTQFPWYGQQPVSIINAWGGVSVIHNFVRKYEKKDGTPQTWPGGTDLMQKYAELDPRFAQTVGYNGSYYDKDVPLLETFQGGRHAADCDGGAWLKKLLPDALSASSGAVPNGIVFRLAEAYLNYAEALNEAQGPVPAAYDAVNTIRQRSGMPKLPTGLTKEQFRDRVRNERDIELAFEDHRLYDIRRWKIAENDGVMQGPFYGLKITKITGSTDFKYEPYVFETRTFLPRMYLHPFLNTEVYKGYLVQNPGY
ncbi:RagB/SusD family nutrient uptake outer membrane protein [Spirosoma sp. HMF3257]|uniref:RagB/SusD family nutrient uptake outer membrane protein n=1 Tax=Spirosoma telluris TaxID=2183553 RepID=A0A327NED7_9BACT|nr:RagB/SusD family nutrient uptake outer membrane protein [Spirosoma telluris]RAI73477.1 RagB/SusD family nutrient uptake outer membrane protein [Spirosoma telluris]